MHHSQGNIQHWCIGMTSFSARFLSTGPSPFARGKKRQQCARKNFVFSFSHGLKKRTKKTPRQTICRPQAKAFCVYFCLVSVRSNQGARCWRGMVWVNPAGPEHQFLLLVLSLWLWLFRLWVVSGIRNQICAMCRPGSYPLDPLVTSGLWWCSRMVCLTLAYSGADLFGHNQALSKGEITSKRGR